MKTILLTQDKVAFVDDEDYAYLNQYKWYTQKTQGKFYARRRTGKDKVYMHQELLSVSLVDHIDRDGLNNQRYNLRESNSKGNARNRGLSKSNTSGFKGVVWYKGKWEARIRVDGKTLRLGSFDDPLLAAMLYDNTANELFGEFACTNKTLGTYDKISLQV